jgi:hypothetical protein
VPGTWVTVDGCLQRRWWQAGGGRRSQLQVVATAMASVRGPSDVPVHEEPASG